MKWVARTLIASDVQQQIEHTAIKVSKETVQVNNTIINKTLAKDIHIFQRVNE